MHMCKCGPDSKMQVSKLGSFCSKWQIHHPNARKEVQLRGKQQESQGNGRLSFFYNVQKNRIALGFFCCCFVFLVYLLKSVKSVHVFDSAECMTSFESDHDSLHCPESTDTASALYKGMKHITSSRSHVFLKVASLDSTMRERC